MDYSNFAKTWERDWNSHDLDRILSHYTPDIIFRSRKALTFVGTGEIHGRAALRAYWHKALSGQPDLHFTVLQVFEGHRMLTLTYRNHKGVLAAETLWFDAHGLIHRAAACHAA